MLLKRALFIGLFVFAAMALAGHDPQPTARKPVPDRPSAKNVPSPSGRDLSHINRQTGLAQGRVEREQAGDLIPRKPLRKPAEVIKPPVTSGKLIVKFRDEVKARSRDEGRVVSLAGVDTTDVEQLAADLGVRFLPALHRDDAKLAELEQRAAVHSGKAQPDLAGIMYVQGPPDALEQAAATLHAMDIVEYVEFEPQWELDLGLGTLGACCMPDGSCAEMTERSCLAAGGSYLGGGTLCPDPPDPCGVCAGSCFDPAGNGTPGCFNALNPDCCSTVCDLIPETAYCCTDEWDAFCAEVAAQFCGLACGHPAAGSCFESNGNPYCNIEGCCETVCEIEPLCCDADEQWDDLCAAIAGLFCEGCNANSGTCYEPNGTPGCDDPACCDLVCEIDPMCCDEEWDTNCALIAQFGCESPTGCPSVGSCLDAHPTPGCENGACCELVCIAEPLCCDFAWDEGCVDLAASLCQSDDTGPTPDFTPLQGYRSLDTGGFDLEPTPFDPYAGLYGLGAFVFEVLGVGEQNQARGATINVGVVEFQATINHEDLDVNLDPELEPDDLFFFSPAHGTATLGEIVGLENGFGVTGIAPDAQGWFFPIEAISTGGRAFAAWTSALMTFGPGDVLSASYGPVGCGTLASGETMWILFRQASDLGITVCLSAGNDCCNLETAPQFDGEDSGVIIVGAGFAGPPWCRLGFSNFHESPNSANVDEQVHVQAWGTAITTLGYGGLFLGDADPNRAYTAGFGGTSSAAPMIAGLVANLQGLAKQFYGIALAPEQIRSIITGCPGSAFPQCLVPFCDEDLLPGEPDIDPPTPCVGDLDPEGDPNVIGPFPRAVECGLSVITSNWFDSAPLIDDITILRGNLVYGNVFSIKASDNNYLVIESEYTTPSHGGGGGPENPQYISFGEVTDVLVTAHADLPGASALLVEVESHTSSGTSIMFVELWDWGWNRYAFVGFAGLRGLIDGLDPLFQFPVDGASRYINQSDQRVLIRVWTLAVGGNSPPGFGLPPNDYRVHHDLINLELFEDFGDIFEPNP